MISPNDNLRPSEVFDVLRDARARMENLRPEMEEHKATYLTKYWAYARQAQAMRPGGNNSERWTETTEVNRLWSGVETHVSQLYPQARRVVLGPDEAGRGDASVSQTALNAWWRKEGTMGRILAHLRQALLYPGSGMTMEVRPGRGSPIHRVEFTVTPYWEMVLDTDVYDTRHQRYRGRRYWLPLRKALSAWPQLAEMNVVGGPREEFLRPVSSGSVVGTAIGGDAAHTNGSNVISSQYAKSPSGGEDRGSEWVEVVEFVNLVDGYEDEIGAAQGRFEVYILGQAGKLASEPLVRSRVPFADADGVPLPHVVSTMMAFEPEYPLRGVPPLRRIMPQQRELNTLRTEVLRRVRQNVDKIVIKGDAWGSEQRQQLSSGVNLEMIKLETDEDIRATVMQLSTAPIGQDLRMYADIVERDLNIVMQLSANRIGQQNKGATAYEVQSINMFDDAETRKHATMLESTCAELSRLALAGFILAAQTPADHRGGYTAPRADQKFAATAVVDGPNVPVAVDVAAAATADAQKAASVAVDPAALALVGGPPVGVPTVTDAEIGPDGVQTQTAVPEQAWSVLDPETGKPIQVTSDKLDGNFTIMFVDGPETPLTAQAVQQNLVAIQQTYMGLWDVVVKGGPMSVIAYRYMVALHDKLKLPRDLHPDKLREAWEEEQKKAPAPPPKAAARVAAPPPEAPAAESGTGKLLATLDAIAQQAAAGGAEDVAQMLGQVSEAVKRNDLPGALAAMDEAYSLASMGGHVDIEGMLGPLKGLMEEAADAMLGETPEEGA